MIESYLRHRFADLNVALDKAYSHKRESCNDGRFSHDCKEWLDRVSTPGWRGLGKRVNRLKWTAKGTAKAQGPARGDHICLPGSPTSQEPILQSSFGHWAALGQRLETLNIDLQNFRFTNLDITGCSH